MAPDSGGGCNSYLNYVVPGLVAVLWPRLHCLAIWMMVMFVSENHLFPSPFFGCGPIAQLDPWCRILLWPHCT